MISLSFQYGPDDLLAFARFLQERSPQVQASLRRGQFIFPGIMLLGLFYAAWRNSQLLAVIYVGLAVAWYLIFPRIFWRRVNNATIKMLKDPSFQKSFGNTLVNLDDAGISSSSPVGDAKYKWDAVENVFLTPTHLHIVLAGMTGYPIARDQVGEELIQAAKSFAESKIAKNEQSESTDHAPSVSPNSP